MVRELWLLRAQSLREEGERARAAGTRRGHCAHHRALEQIVVAAVDLLQAAQRRVASLQAEGAKETLGNKEKDELLAKLEELQQITAETDMLSLQLKRRVAS